MTLTGDLLFNVRGIPLGVVGLAVSMVAFGSLFGNLTGGALSDRRTRY